MNSFDLQVMCDCYTPAGEPIPTNKRHNAAKIFSNPEVAAEEPWYANLPLYICDESQNDLSLYD
jgi:hypothetical protein